MERFFFAAGAVSGGLAVASGAFGAHALRGHLSPEALAVFETGARYHMYHALALLAAGWAAGRWPGRGTRLAGAAFLAGTLLFAGSLYGLALTGWRLLAFLTPLGGLTFLAGWAGLALAAARGR
jgi:uncharacterized membrane protein YgdD (TMEM256/DUF423 family)